MFLGLGSWVLDIQEQGPRNEELLCMSHRPQQLAGIFRSVVASFALTAPPDIAQAISIVEVKISSDLSYADVYVTAIDSVKKAIEFLKANEKEIRKNLSEQLSLHKLPQLRFHKDETGERGARIEKLLQEL